MKISSSFNTHCDSVFLLADITYLKLQCRCMNIEQNFILQYGYSVICYAVFSYHETKSTFYLTNLLGGVKESYRLSLSLYHLSHANECTVSHSNIHSASSEALKNFQPKIRKLLRRFRKQRRWSSEDTKITFHWEARSSMGHVPTQVCDFEHLPEYLVCRAQLVVVNQNQRWCFPCK